MSREIILLDEGERELIEAEDWFEAQREDSAWSSDLPSKKRWKG
ncbi:MAG: hypothetical protein V3T83_19150 [Acidobacteriota bacterium]